MLRKTQFINETWIKTILNFQNSSLIALNLSFKQFLKNKGLSPDALITPNIHYELTQEEWMPWFEQYRNYIYVTTVLTGSYLSHLINNKLHPSKLHSIIVNLATHPAIENVVGYSYFRNLALLGVSPFFPMRMQTEHQIPGSHCLMSFIYTLDNSNPYTCSSTLDTWVQSINNISVFQYYLSKIADAVTQSSVEILLVQRRKAIIEQLITHEIINRIKQNEPEITMLECASGTGEIMVSALNKAKLQDCDVDRVKIISIEMDNLSRKEHLSRLNDPSNSLYHPFKNNIQVIPGNINLLDPVGTLNHCYKKIAEKKFLEPFINNDRLSVDILFQTGIDDYLDQELTIEPSIISKTRAHLQRHWIHSQEGIVWNRVKQYLGKGLRWVFDNQSFKYQGLMVNENFKQRSNLLKQHGLYITAVMSREKYESQFYEIEKEILYPSGYTAIKNLIQILPNALEDLDFLIAHGMRSSGAAWLFHYNNQRYIAEKLENAQLIELPEFEILNALLPINSLYDKKRHPLKERKDGLHIFAYRKSSL